ncbi:hypothetical protein ZEAMMB73_Zm00001d042696 [Zea mays]|uniref:ATP synthase subunit beta, mitochondrial n=2 Tax=Zea mays TaxID=4577 RepID=A0A1D6N670_MAIZE|nr:hypothetical protein ZEAMMB73_Zm00001d042696 [Zea mays]
MQPSYIHRSTLLKFMLYILLRALAFVEQATEQQILIIGIKVVDLLAPYQRGENIGLFDGTQEWVKLCSSWSWLIMLLGHMVGIVHSFLLN